MTFSTVDILTCHSCISTGVCKANNDSFTPCWCPSKPCQLASVHNKALGWEHLDVMQSLFTLLSTVGAILFNEHVFGHAHGLAETDTANDIAHMQQEVN